MSQLTDYNENTIHTILRLTEELGKSDKWPEDVISGCKGEIVYLTLKLISNILTFPTASSYDFEMIVNECETLLIKHRLL